MSIVQLLAQTARPAIPAIPEVKDRFIKMFQVTHGGNLEVAQLAYESEKFHFAKLLQDKPDLQQCTPLSLYGCFLDMAVQGLSFDPAMKHAYMVAFPTNVGTKDRPQWESRATNLIDGRGELIIRTRQGQIKYADNPVVVWSCDQFSNGMQGGKKVVNHTAVHPRPENATIIASYLTITRPDGTLDYSVMDIEDVNALKAFSKQPNSLAWTKGLKGMVENKTIKHAFRSYPKVKLGFFSALKTEAIEAPEATTLGVDYGMGDAQLQPASAMLQQGAPMPDFAQQAEPQQQQQAPQWQQQHQAHQQPQQPVQPAQPMDENSFAQQAPSGPGVAFNDEQF